MINPALLEIDTKEKEIGPPVLWALDSRLPRIAAQAAVEFDWLIQDKHGQFAGELSRESIRKLLWLLSNSIGKVRFNDNNKGFVDSLGLSVFTKAYNESYKARPVRTQEGLVTAVKELTNEFEKANQEAELDEDVLKKMMDFCVALSEYAATYREMLYDNRQDHPYRK